MSGEHTNEEQSVEKSSAVVPSSATDDVVSKTDVPSSSTDVVSKTDVPSSSTDVVRKTDVPSSSTDVVKKTDVPSSSTDVVCKTDVPSSSTDVVSKTDAAQGQIISRNGGHTHEEKSVEKSIEIVPSSSTDVVSKTDVPSSSTDVVSKTDVPSSSTDVVCKTDVPSSSTGVVIRTDAAQGQTISRKDVHGPNQHFHNIVQAENLFMSGDSQGSFSNNIQLFDQSTYNTHAHSVQVIQKDADIYVNTKSRAEVCECLDTKHHVMIIGSAGSGKTAMAYDLLRTYERLGYMIMIASDPQELKRNRNPHKQTIIFINDIFGHSVYDPTLFQKWKDILEEFEPILGYGTNYIQNFKLVCTSRSYIWSEAVSSLGFFTKTLFSENTAIDITDCLSFEEKKRIFNVHAEKNYQKISQDLVDEICKMDSPHGFPHTCFLFFQLEQFHDKVLSFFERPLPCLQESITVLESSDPEKFAVLVLVLLHNGKLEISSMTSDNRHLDYLKKRFPKINSEDVTRSIEKISTHLCKGFLKKEKGTLMFHHPTIQDTLAYVLGKSDQKLIIQNCSAEFLYERVRISDKEHDSDNEDTHWFHIIIQPELWSSLSNRFANEIKNKNFSLICSHPAMTNPDFVRRCFAILSCDDLDIAHTVDNAFSRTILTWSMWNRSHVLCKYLISEFTFEEDTILKSIICCCSSGNVKCMKLLVPLITEETLLSFKTKREQYEYVVSDKSGSFITKRVSKTCSRDNLLLFACECGIDVIDFLLAKGFSMKDTNDKGDGALHKCCMGDNANLLPNLLNYGCEVLATNKAQCIPLHIAAQQGNVNHVLQLLDYKDKGNLVASQISARNRDGDTPLLLACKHDHGKVVKQLIKYGADVNIENMLGQTPVSLARKGKHHDIVCLLMESHLLNNTNNCNEGMPINDTQQVKENPQHSESDENDTAVISGCTRENSTNVQILSITDYTDYQDDHGDTKLMVACKHNHTEAMKLLLAQNEDDVDAQNTEDETALIISSRVGNVENVRLLLDAKPLLNLCNQEGNTGLLVASERGHVEIVKELMRQKTDVDHKNKLDNTPLLLASKYGHDNVIKCLLSKGASANITNHEGNTALIMYCNGGYDKSVKILIKRSDDINICNNAGNTALLMAVQQNNGVAVVSLLEHDADINKTDMSGDSPLIWACRRGLDNVLKLLIDNNADIYKNEDGETPLQLAVSSGNSKCVQIVMSKMESWDPHDSHLVLNLCQKGNKEILEPLLTWSVWICVDGEGNTPLMNACCGGHSEIVRLLLQTKDLDINCQNDYGDTAILIACKRAHYTIIDILLSHKADVTIVNEHGDTAVMVAYRQECRKMWCLLLSQFNQSCLKSFAWQEVFLESSKEGKKEIVETFLKYGISTNVEDKHGNSALIEACKMNHTNVVTVLVEKGVEINHQNQEGKTALYYACKQGNHKTVKLLLSQGAVTRFTDPGIDPLIAACDENQDDIVKELLTNEPNNEMSREALLRACDTGSEVIVTAILANTAISLDFTDYEETPLTTAVIRCFLEIVRELLFYGFDTNQQNKFGGNPLTLACATGNLSVVEILLENNANIWHVDISGNTVLITACKQSNGSLVTYIMGVIGKAKETTDSAAVFVNKKNEDGKTALIVATELSNELVVKELINGSHGLVDVDSTDNNNETALMITSGNGHEKLVLILLSFNADVSIFNDDGENALILACKKAQVTVAKHLLDAKANPQDVCSKGYSPLHWACRNRNIDLVKLLLKYPIDVNVQDKCGITPLMHACQTGVEDIVILLLQTNVDILIRDNYDHCILWHTALGGNLKVMKILIGMLQDNKTPLTPQLGCIVAPLINACRMGHLDIVHALMPYKVNVNTTNDNGDTPLAVAAEEGNIDVVEYLISRGAVVNLCNNNGYTPLMLACRESHEGIVSLLLKQGASVNSLTTNDISALMLASEQISESVVGYLLDGGAILDLTDGNGDTALIKACRRGYLPVAEILLQNHANITVENSYGETPFSAASDFANVLKLLNKYKEKRDFLIACKMGNVNRAKNILSPDRSNDIINVDLKDEHGNTPLLVACKAGHQHIVKFLMSRGADGNFVDSSCNTALHIASMHGHENMPTVLLEYGANVYMKNKKGLTAYEIARYGGKEILADEYLPELVKRESRMFTACRNGHLRQVKKMLSEGYDKNKPNQFGETPLMLVLGKVNIEIVTFLLSNHAHLDSKTQFNDTVLMYACKGGDFSLVKKILSRSECTDVASLINQTNCFDITPLIIASMYGHGAVVELLLQQGANPTMADKDGNTALMYSCRYGHYKVTKLLANAKSLAHCKVNGNRPLHEACSGGHLKVVDVLLSQEINVDVQNAHGDTALTIASERGHIEMVKKLLKHGAYINHSNNDGFTALMYACQHGHQDIALDLIEYGAHTGKRNKGGKTHFQLAMENGYTEIGKLSNSTDKDGDLYENVVESWMNFSGTDDSSHRNSKSDSGLNARLLIACRSGSEAVLSSLLSTGVDVNVNDDSDDIPLLTVCRTGNNPIALTLINSGATVNVRNRFAETPLMIACKYGFKDIVESLLVHKADVNAKNNMEYTALMWTSVNGNGELTKMLLSQEAEVNAVNMYGYTAIMLAEIKGHSDIVDQLAPHVTLQAKAISACIQGNQLFLSEMKGKIAINLRDSKKNTLLMNACKHGHINIVSDLVRSRADINLGNSYQETALMLACRAGREGIVKILLQNGAVLNLQNDKGETELFLACAGGHLNVVRSLLEYGADGRIASHGGERPVTAATKGGHKHLVKLLSGKKHKRRFKTFWQIE